MTTARNFIVISFLSQVVIVFSPLFFPNLHMSQAQTNTPAELSDTALADQALSEWSTVSAILMRIEELSNRFRKERDAAEEATVAVNGILLPEKPDSISDKLGLVQEAESAVNRWIERGNLNERLLQLYAELDTLTNKKRDAALLLINELDLYKKWLADTEYFREELTNRTANGTLDNNESITQILALKPREDSETRELRENAERDVFLSKSVADRTQKIEATMFEDAAALAQAQMTLRWARLDNQLFLDYEAMSENDRLVSLNEILSERNARSETLLSLRATATMALNSYYSAIEETQEINVTNTIADTDLGSEEITSSLYSALSAVQRSIKAVSERIQLEEEKITRLGSVKNAAPDVLVANTEFLASLDVYLDITSRAAILAELTTTDNAKKLISDLKALRDESYEVGKIEPEITANLALISDQMASAQTALDEAMRILGERERALTREEAWVEFIERAQALNTDALTDTFLSVSGEMSGLQDWKSEVARETSRELRNVEEITDKFSRTYDPVGVAMTKDETAFISWRGSVGLTPESALEQESTEDVAGRVAQPDEVGALSGNVAQVAYREILAQSRERRDLLLERQEFYKNHAAIIETLEIAIGAAITSLQTRSEVEEEMLTVAQQAWGAASVLKERITVGDADGKDLETTIDTWADRDRVLAIEKTLLATRSEIAHLNNRLASLADGTIGNLLVSPLDRMVGLHQDQVEALVSLLNFSEQFGFLDGRDKLDTLSQKLLDKEASDRFFKSLGIYGYFDELFGGTQLLTIDELLVRYFERLILLERQVANLDDQRAQLGLVQKVASELRPITESVTKHVTALSAENREALDVATASVKAALAPERAGEILDDLEARTGQRLAVSQLPVIEAPKDSNDPDASLAAAKETAILNLAPAWANAEGYAQWRRNLEQLLAPLGGLDHQISRLEQVSQQLSAQRTEIEQRVERLTGLRVPETTGNETKTELNEQQAEQQRFLAGEIGVLQSDRENTIQQNAIRSGAAVIIIPIIALIVYWMGRFFSMRLFRRIAERQDEQSNTDDHARRSETLNGIFQSAWLIAILVLTSVYLLKAFHVDITPIVASLGILGLAVAFGAQTIMRDLFAGFFLLVENQLNRGDVVEINGLLGKVERVGLRTTVLRADDDGFLHYFPNGLIDNVANRNRQWWRVRVDLKIPFDVDYPQSLKVLKQVIKEIEDEPAYAGLLQGAGLLDGDGPSSVDFEFNAFVWIVFFDLTTDDEAPVADFRQRIVKRFESENIPLAMPKEIQILGGGKDTTDNEIKAVAIPPASPPRGRKRLANLISEVYK